MSDTLAVWCMFVAVFCVLISVACAVIAQREARRAEDVLRTIHRRRILDSDCSGALNPCGNCYYCEGMAP